MNLKHLCKKCNAFKLFEDLPYCYSCYKQIAKCRDCGSVINWDRIENFKSLCKNCDKPFK